MNNLNDLNIKRITNKEPKAIFWIIVLGILIIIFVFYFFNNNKLIKQNEENINSNNQTKNEQKIKNDTITPPEVNI